MNYYPIVLSFITFLATLLGGYVAARYRNRFGVIASFSAGVLIAVPLFQLLPTALQLAQNLAIPYQNLLYIMAVGFIFLYMLERLLAVKRVPEGNSWKYIRHSAGGLFGASELALHSFVDGFAIGVGFHYDFQIGMLVAVAVIFHDFPDGINTVAVMLSSGNSLKAAMRMLLLDAITPVLGATLSLFITLLDQYLAYLLSFFAGGFLYLGASELLPEAHEEIRPVVAFGCTLAGFLIIFIAARFITF
jgi:zinc transporter ZupT